MEVDERLSRKIRVLSFIAAIAVVLIHSNTNGTNASDWNVFVQTLLSKGITGWAVPFFFLVSGFWFGRSTNDIDIRGFIGMGYGNMLRKKFRGLILPYVLWCVLGAIIQLPILCFANHVAKRDVFQSTVLEGCGVWTFFDRLWGICRSAPVGNFPLWFLRALIIIFIAAPIWIALRTYFPRAILLLLGVVMIACDVNVPLLCISLAAAGWFLTGFTLAGFKVAEMKFISRPFLLFCGLSYFAFATSEALCAAGWIDVGSWRVVLKRSIPFAGIPFWWMLYDVRLDKTSSLPTCFNDTFWIYCIHQAFVTYIIGAGFYLLGKGDVVSLVLMAGSVIASTALSILSAQTVRRCFPKAYRLLSGGR